MAGSKVEQKKRDYDEAMAAQSGARSAVSGMADPFGEYPVSDFLDELAILEALGKAWKMQFCQATMGFVRRPGGLWVAYTVDCHPKSVLHVERFIGKSTDWPQINFWAEHISTGKLVAERYKLPFVVVVQFNDGRFAIRFDKDPVESVTTIGSRVAKGKDYPDTVNMVTYFDIDVFARISKSESAD